MEWKKEKITASELERKQKEYMNAALSMMKRSGAAHRDIMPVPDEEPHAVTSVRPEKKPDMHGGTDITPAFDDAADAAEKAAETTAEKAAATAADKAEEKAEDNMPAASDEKAEDAGETDAKTEEEPKQSEEDAGSTKFGVYTADELISGEYKDDGLKKAAEILEEMTRNTAFMKKLADSGDDSGDGENDPDTTDFPDFSCDFGDDDENSFRPEQCAEDASEKCEAKENE